MSWAPRDSATNLNGTKVVPFFVPGGTGNVTGWPFTNAVLFPRTSSICVCPRTILIDLFSWLKSTFADRPSPMSLSGTMVVPFSRYGATVSVTIFPFTKASLLPIEITTDLLRFPTTRTFATVWFSAASFATNWIFCGPFLAIPE